MPHVRGPWSGGFIEVKDPVRFMKGIDLNHSWGSTWYVDYDNGSDASAGTSPAAAFQNPATAIAAASAWDVIYIKPRDPDTSGGDPNHITPATAANWTIASTKHGLSLIGAGAGRGYTQGYQASLKGYAGLTTPTLYVKAPFVSLENLSFRGATACTAGIVKFSFTNSGADQSFGSSLYNDTFWKASSTMGGALVMDAAWYMNILNSHFLSCYKGIVIGASNSVPVGIQIADCNWQGLTTEVSTCIESSGSVTNILIQRTYMNHALPAGGGSNKFIVFAAASTGEWMDSYIGATATTVATNTTLNGVGYSHIYVGSNAGLMTTA